MKHRCRLFYITCLWSRDASYLYHTLLKDMTIVGATYQMILNRLMLQSCQLCEVAHDFRYDPRITSSEAQISQKRSILINSLCEGGIGLEKVHCSEG
jgi:hypothetical protein